MTDRMTIDIAIPDSKMIVDTRGGRETSSPVRRVIRGDRCQYTRGGHRLSKGRCLCRSADARPLDGTSMRQDTTSILPRK